MLWACSFGWCLVAGAERKVVLLAGGWFVLREKYCWLVAGAERKVVLLAGGWFVLREKYC
jgi:very-short-patch-repair endonuclease